MSRIPMGNIRGPRGNGIASIEQTTTSTEDEGKNVITITDVDENTYEFSVQNGSKGSTGDKGDKGDTGDPGYVTVTASAGEHINEEGTPTVTATTSTDGTAVDLAFNYLKGITGDIGVQGPQGEQGETGVGIESIASETSTVSGENNTITITLTDGTVKTFIVRNGIDGTSVKFSVVESLPETGESGIFYLVSNGSTEGDNIYDEYIWTGSAYELLGNTKIDLTDYVKTEDLANYVTSDSMPFVFNSNSSTGIQPAIGGSANGGYSFATGFNPDASGDYSYSGGYNTIASGKSSHAEGFLTDASGDYSYSGGKYTIAASEAQTVIGKYNVEDNSGQYAFIIGNGSSNTAQSNAFTVDWSGNIATANTIQTNLASTSSATLNTSEVQPGVTGTLAVDNGGTGQTTANAAANSFANALTTGSSDPVDADYYIAQYAGGGTTTTTYHRRPHSALWNYIKKKISSAVSLTRTSGTDNIVFNNGTSTTTVSIQDTIHFFVDDEGIGIDYGD